MFSLYSDLYQLAVNQRFVALYSTAGSKLAVKMIVVIKYWHVQSCCPFSSDTCFKGQMLIVCMTKVLSL